MPDLLITRGLIGTPAGVLVRGLGFGGPAPSIDLRQALRAYLAADAQLAAIVGARVRPGGFGEADPMPSLSYAVLSYDEEMGLDGTILIVWARVRLDCWSRKLSECVAVRKRLRDVLHGFSGPMGGLAVIRSKKVGEVDLHEPAADGSDSWLYRVSTDYRIKFTVPAPAP